jgi:type I restriction-modification system DNA methylase subunit
MKNFFEKIDFTFGDKASDIKPSKIIISENPELTEKLANNVYLFDSPSQTNSSFYVITIALIEQDLFELRRFIWNENKYDLYFLAETQTITKLCYAKTNPREPEIKIKSFNLTEDSNELEEIRKWRFNSGAFWLSYKNVLDKIKKVGKIDTKLIEQLKKLKIKLQNELKDIDNESSKVVQALIDRTLFIKFLEDNHIINSTFYNHYFTTENNINFSYKTLLEKHDIEGINKLFEEINKIFNNILFKTPFIKKECLNNNVLNLIHDAISQHDWNTGQLSLFDFRFDVIPTEFISHIYEVFLEDYQLDEGIYYTPTKLVHLIIDDTISGLGTVLDPACGSGMFLVLSFRKVLEINPPEQNISVYEKIAHKNRLLQDYITE